MTIIFFVHLVATFCSIAIAWFLQTVHYPLLRYIGPQQYPVYFEQQKMKLVLLTFPIMSLEVFSSVVLIMSFAAKAGHSKSGENSFFLYLFSVLLLFIIHLITFRYIRPALKKLATDWNDKNLKNLQMASLLRAGLWTARIVLIFITIIQPT